jgi:hypothetical protein
MFGELNVSSQVLGGNKMLSVPFLDLSMAAILLFFFYYGLVASLFVILVEATILWLLQWGTFLRSFRDAGLANFATTALGLLLYMSYAPPWLDIFNESRFTSNMFILWALSSIFEGVALCLISQKRFPSTMLTSCLINLCSYIPLSLWINANFLN